jgi:hypothetical protein
LITGVGVINENLGKDMTIGAFSPAVNFATGVNDTGVHRLSARH